MAPGLLPPLLTAPPGRGEVSPLRQTAAAEASGRPEVVFRRFDFLKGRCSGCCCLFSVGKLMGCGFLVMSKVQNVSLHVSW